MRGLVRVRLPGPDHRAVGEDELSIEPSINGVTRRRLAEAHDESLCALPADGVRMRAPCHGIQCPLRCRGAPHAQVAKALVARSVRGEVPAGSEEESALATGKSIEKAGEDALQKLRVQRHVVFEDDSSRRPVVVSDHVEHVRVRYEVPGGRLPLAMVRWECRVDRLVHEGEGNLSLAQNRTHPLLPLWEFGARDDISWPR